jgi:hypothetical protein
MDDFRTMVSKEPKVIYKDHGVTAIVHGKACTLSDGRGSVQLPEHLYLEIGRVLEQAHELLHMKGRGR